jgi:hypothetical protein
MAQLLLYLYRTKHTNNMKNVINPSNLLPQLSNTFEYEIYTKNPITGQPGWDIQFITIIANSRKEAKELLRRHPNFDCIITVEFDAERGY